MKSAKLPDFSYEKAPWRAGFNCVGGIDEVGRGSFAGPVVAACAVFPSQIPHPSGEVLINDSKKLSTKQREVADKWIRKNALAFGIGKASVSQINRLGIKKATEIAFRKAIKACGVRVDYILIDAFFIPYVKGLRRKNQKAIIKGDGKSVSIAAASIIAKVYRDNLMTDLSKKRQYKKYLWAKNKGYGTKEHLLAIKKYGTTRMHRKAYVETWLRSSSFSPTR